MTSALSLHMHGIETRKKLAGICIIKYPCPAGIYLPKVKKGNSSNGTMET